MSLNPNRGKIKRRAWILVLSITLALVFGVWLLVGQQRRARAKSIHCVGNLVHIRLAKIGCQEDLGLADGSPIPEEALESAFEDLGQPLAHYKCPSGGTYVMGNAGITPKCTYTNVCSTYRLHWAKLRLERQAWKHSLEP
jgi:hypothetical protein